MAVGFIEIMPAHVRDCLFARPADVEADQCGVLFEAKSHLLVPWLVGRCPAADDPLCSNAFRPSTTILPVSKINDLAHKAPPSPPKRFRPAGPAKRRERAVGCLQCAPEAHSSHSPDIDAARRRL